MTTMSTINIKGDLMDLSKPKIMGIINATPDSFFSGSRIDNLNSLSEQVEKMISQGVDILDIGAYSSRPGAVDISVEEELARLIPFVKHCSENYPQVPISVDTFRSKVAIEAVENGAAIINDISGGSLDEKMFETVAALQVPYIIMHMRGNPQNMQNLTDYENIVEEIIYYFSEKLNKLHQLGLNDVIIDPGFGFSKTLEQNYRLMSELESLNILGKEILVGISRKSMINKLLDITADQALNGTSVLNTVALMKGAKILRVHDVKEAVQARSIFLKLMEQS